MRLTKRLQYAVLCFGLSLGFQVNGANTDVIIQGSGGEPGYTQRFNEWGARLSQVLQNPVGHDPSRIHRFGQAGTEGIKPNDLKSLRSFFAGLAQSHESDAHLFIYLIGHGSYLRNQANFQIDGPDLSAEDLKQMLEKVPAAGITIVNGGSASAGFINILSGGNRIICTATKTAYEQNATEYIEFFVQSLESASADRNRDERISVWEATQQAAGLTAAWYTSQGLIATEHALLDDNGDGLGTRLYQDPDEPHKKTKAAPDGNRAKRLYIKDLTFPPSVPQSLINQYRVQLDEIEALKGRKSKMDQSAYYQALETKLVQAARTNQEIHRLAESKGK